MLGATGPVRISQGKLASWEGRNYELFQDLIWRNHGRAGDPTMEWGNQRLLEQNPEGSLWQASGEQTLICRARLGPAQISNTEPLPSRPNSWGCGLRSRAHQDGWRVRAGIKSYLLPTWETVSRGVHYHLLGGLGTTTFIPAHPVSYAKSSGDVRKTCS